MAGVAALVLLSSVLLLERTHSMIAETWARMFSHRVRSGLANARANDSAVTIGQFFCSGKDATEAKRLAPIGSLGVESDTEALEAKQRELDDLKTEIDAAPDTYLPGPSVLDYRRQLVDRYNSLLTSYQSDAAALRQRANTYKSQSLALSNYVEKHCRKLEQ